MQELTALSGLSGNLTDIVKSRLPKIYVELGVGNGDSLREVMQEHDASYLGVDVKITDKARELECHLIEAPADFVAKGYGPKSVDMLYIDLIDSVTEKTDHFLRYIIHAWLDRAKCVIVPNQTHYTNILDGLGLNKYDWGEFAEYTHPTFCGA